MRNVRIFISSPSDVAEERAAAREIVESLPRTPFLRGRISLELVAWDDPAAPAAMFANLTPQAAVNRGLARPSECDLTIVILWSRMGTPLAEPLKKDGTPYLSGTEWEYQDAIEAGKDVMLYRRTAKVRVDLDDRAFEDKRRQQRLLEQFFSRFTAPHGALTGSYTSGTKPSRSLEGVCGRISRPYSRACWTQIHRGPRSRPPYHRPPLRRRRPPWRPRSTRPGRFTPF